MSKENARLYAYYEELIKEYTESHPNANDKLALALILGRGFRPTLSKTRDLALLDTDKLLSMQHKSLMDNDPRSRNMRMAADLTGLKNNLLVRGQEVPLGPQGETPNRGNLQIFRLIRAAQNHYFGPRGATQPSSQEDIINNSV